MRKILRSLTCLTAVALFPVAALAVPAPVIVSPPTSPTVSIPLQYGSGMTNAMSFACGITIGDGGTHTVGNAPAGSCFNGVTTLGGLAAITINGTTPFSFLTDSGSVTGPLGTPGSSTNPFTSATGVYKLTNAKVANLDIAWLAIQAAVLTRRAYIPTGKYEIGTAMALPVMIPMSPSTDETNPMDLIVGDGPGSSVLLAGSSFGSLNDSTSSTRNIPLMACGDPSATPTNALGRWNNGNMCSGYLEYLGFLGNSGSSITSTYATDGIALGAHLDVFHVLSSYFYNDATIVGDHTTYDDLQLNAGIRGLYWDAPINGVTGDQLFRDFSSSGQVLAAVAVNGNASMAGTYSGETYLNAGGYAIYGEANACTPLIYAAHFQNLMTEYLGLGVMTDDHNFNSSTGAYTDSAKCRNVDDFEADKWFVTYYNPAIIPGTNRRRRATVDVGAMSGVIHDITESGGTAVPSADNTGAAGVAVFNVNQIVDNNTYLGIEIDGNVIGLFSAAATTSGANGPAIPIFPASAVGSADSAPGDGARWTQTGVGSGYFVQLATAGSYTTTTTGDLLEYQSGSYRVAQPAGANPGQPVMGVVQESGLTNGMVVPIQTTGQAFMSAGYHYGNDGFQKKSTGVGGSTTFVPGSGGTPGSYTITATGGGCSSEPSYTVTVGSNGSISGVTSPNSTSPTGCTSTPSVSLSSVTGLTGGSVTPQWPAAGVTTAANAQDGVIVGYGLHLSSGSTSAGTSQQYSHLLSMN